MDYAEISKRLRDLALELGKEMPAAPNDWVITPDQIACNALQIAWCDAMLEKFDKLIEANPHLKRSMAIATELMHADGYGKDGRIPLVIPAGMKPYIAKVDGDELLAFFETMPMAIPLTAVYLDKVTEVMDIADRIDSTKAPISSP